MIVIYLVFTALSVSLDSFFCGLSTSSRGDNDLITLLGISGTVFLLCFTASTIGTQFSEFLSGGADILGGAILIVVAAYGLIRKEDKNLLIKPKQNSLIQAIIIGFSIGLDGALGCFSLTVLGMNAMLVTVYITAFHVLLLELSFIAASKLKKLAERFRFLPPLILFALGYFKLINALI